MFFKLYFFKLVLWLAGFCHFVANVMVRPALLIQREIANLRNIRPIGSDNYLVKAGLH